MLGNSYNDIATWIVEYEILPILRSPLESAISCDHIVDSFYILERSGSSSFLLPNERNLDTRLNSIILKRLSMFDDLGDCLGGASQLSCASSIYKILTAILETKLDGIKLGFLLWNQELPYIIDSIIRRILSISFEDSPQMLTEYRYRCNLDFQYLLPVISSTESVSLTYAFRWTLASGLIGSEAKDIDLCSAAIRPKSVASRCSEYLQMMKGSYYAHPLMEAFEAELLELLCKPGAKVLWCFDDYMESLVDLTFLERIFCVNSTLTLGVLTRSRCCDSDISAKELYAQIESGRYKNLKGAIEDGRIIIFAEQPKTGAPRVETLHLEIAEFILHCDAVFVKGNRIHEMWQGSINALVYYGYVLVNQFSESQMGISANTHPLVLLKGLPGVPNWWGFIYRGSAQASEKGDNLFSVPISVVDVLDALKSGFVDKIADRAREIMNTGINGRLGCRLSKLIEFLSGVS